MRGREILGRRSHGESEPGLLNQKVEEEAREEADAKGPQTKLTYGHPADLIDFELGQRKGEGMRLGAAEIGNQAL